MLEIIYKGIHADDSFQITHVLQLFTKIIKTEIIYKRNQTGQLDLLIYSKQLVYSHLHQGRNFCIQRAQV